MAEHGCFLSWVCLELQAKVGFLHIVHLQALEVLFSKRTINLSAGALVPFIGPLVGKVFNSLGVQAQDGTDSQAATDSIVAGGSSQTTTLTFS